MIIDAHTHIFPDEVIANRQAFFKGEAAFELLLVDPEARMVSAAELLAAMDKDGVDISIVCGFPWLDTAKARLHNDIIIEAGRKYPDRLVPLACVNALDQDGLAEAERALAGGAAGLGELAAYLHDLADSEVKNGMIRLAKLCAEADKPLMLHTNEPVGRYYPGKSPMSLAGLYELVKACPETRFQLAHFGGGLPFYQLLKFDISQVLKNCVYDTAAAPFVYKPDMYPQFCKLAGEDKLLYGSDYPLLSLGRYQKEMRLGGIDSQLEQKLLSTNAEAFWRLAK